MTIFDFQGVKFATPQYPKHPGVVFRAQFFKAYS